MSFDWEKLNNIDIIQESNKQLDKKIKLMTGTKTELSDVVEYCKITISTYGSWVKEAFKQNAQLLKLKNELKTLNSEIDTIQNKSSLEELINGLNPSIDWAKSSLINLVTNINDGDTASLQQGKDILKAYIQAVLDQTYLGTKEK